MKDFKLDDVQLVLANPHSSVRSGLRMALNDAGIDGKNIIDGGEVDTISEAMQSRLGPDVLICDTSVRGGDILRMLQAIRHNDIGPNPFLSIIAVSSDSSLAAVREVMDTGADLFIAAPVSPQQILDRLKWLVHNRKPFVVTPNYVGPDRRKEHREDDMMERIDAPNTLRYKAVGRWDPDYVALEIKAAVGELNDQKMQRHAFSLARTAEEFALENMTDPVPPSRERLQQFLNSMVELKKRAVSIGLDPVARLCAAAQSVIAKLHEPNLAEVMRDIEILQQLTFAIRASVNPNERESGGLAHAIANVVTGTDKA